jgi:hypothetical protein
MVTKRTDRGRPNWDLLLDRDRYLIAAFWATLIHDNQLKGDQKVTRHAVAMTYAAIERGEMMGSSGFQSLETARKLGCDEDKERFEKSLGKIAAYKPPKTPKAKKAAK